MNYKAVINEDNIALLNETIELINTLSKDSYTQKLLLIQADTPGAHVRHIIEHYELFLEGLLSGEINYDARKRNLLLSSEPQEAIAKIMQIVSQLNGITRDDLGRLINVKMDTGKVCDQARTSVARELQFLWSHHVHHNAIIRMILESSGLSCHKDFGVAASTAKYQGNQNQCAR